MVTIKDPKISLKKYGPEELVIHELFIIFGPIISELGNLKIEASDGVCAKE